jgi:hypothetical protein
MTLTEYEIARDKIGFEEYPDFIFADMIALQSFIPFEKADIDLRIHLTEVLICRSFPVSGGIYMPYDVEWFIQRFLEDYTADNIIPWRVQSIKVAVDLITSDDTFGKLLVGTTYMYGIIEYYSKCFLGYNFQVEHLNGNIEEKYKSMSLSQAINRLRKMNHPVARSINRIDNYHSQRLKEREMYEHYKDNFRLENRLSTVRNKLLHGWNSNDYAEGELLVLLYMLFHFHWQKQPVIIKENDPV